MLLTKHITIFLVSHRKHPICKLHSWQEIMWFFTESINPLARANIVCWNTWFNYQQIEFNYFVPWSNIHQQLFYNFNHLYCKSVRILKLWLPYLIFHFECKIFDIKFKIRNLENPTVASSYESDNILNFSDLLKFSGPKVTSS